VDTTAEARRILAATTYLVLATVDGDGRPWATPLWFAARDLTELVWVSRPETRHSVTIAARPAVAITVFDSTVPVGAAAAFYAEAEAAEADLAALAVFNARARAQGIGEWSEQDVSGRFRLYSAHLTRAWVLDETETRREVFR
jgi:pyridoxine/pyridoxamine 5'-phosphate oxidase